MIRFIPPLLIAAVAVLLTGCSATWQLRAKCTTAQQCEVEGTIGGSFIVEKSGISLPIDVSSTVISVAGSTISVPASGMVTLRAVNSSSGSTVGVFSNGWVRNGSEIRFASPAAVNAWASSMYGATALEFSLDSFPVQAPQGLNVFSASLSHAGLVRAGQTTYWNAGCTQFYCDEP